MSNRFKLYVYRDQTSEARLKHISIHEGTECALLFAFLDRYSATTHRCGIWKHSPEDMALSLGMDSGDEVRGMLNSLAPYKILFDHETNTVLNLDQMEQYASFSGNRKNYLKQVDDQLSTLPDSALKQRFCERFGIAFEPLEIKLEDASSTTPDSGCPQWKEREVKGDMSHDMSHDMRHDMKTAQVSQKREVEADKKEPDSGPQTPSAVKGVKHA